MGERCGYEIGSTDMESVIPPSQGKRKLKQPLGSFMSIFCAASYIPLPHQNVVIRCILPRVRMRYVYPIYPVVLDFADWGGVAEGGKPCALFFKCFFPRLIARSVDKNCGRNDQKHNDSKYFHQIPSDFVQGTRFMSLRSL